MAPHPDDGRLLNRRALEATGKSLATIVFDQAERLHIDKAIMVVTLGR